MSRSGEIKWKLNDQKRSEIIMKTERNNTTFNRGILLCYVSDAIKENFEILLGLIQIILVFVV